VADPDPIPFPRASEARFEADLVQVQAAIDLVADGVARRVFLTGLVDPKAAASLGAALAQRFGVALGLDRENGRRTLRVGPRI
jgi:hypothetical protein